ncbi:MULTISPECIES: DUF6101 family protein [unclassified Aureimonas]|uniref:DUF6101 family protein n=1 Tax=unclassified Aureimonas TaxID=2615206 RepID=UPI0007021B09|nr:MULTISPECIES: DUF6101 family protein [unclassified Aureimonas]KQT65124.1 hypothetical protein ASG62_22260 [Aureimonas sp. Leaf427]KQT76226.1 hypothetical protein ASG54_15915 [Aureimonas sp. Leaf460]
MTKATQTVSNRPEWADMPIRVDPAFADRRQTFEMMQDGETVAYRIDRRGVVITRALERSGIPMSIALPARAFKGVAARAMEDDTGAVTVTLELHHADPKLSVPLLVASDLYDVAADWRSWSDLFNLPMLMVEAGGAVVPLEETLGQVRSTGAAPRRRSSSAHSMRRPRFLARRKPGGLGLALRISGQEIIARD